MADWDRLGAELDRWAGRGGAATFWWRDDDAGPEDGRLAGLLARRRALGAPLALAVVPGRLAPAVRDAIAADGAPRVLQHGADHADRAGGSRRKTELAAGALGHGLAGALEAGRRRLEDGFGAAFLPVMVPPWNRADDAVARRLAGLGFEGLSALGPRPGPARHGLALANVHIDIVDWKTGPRFAGEERALGAALNHLEARRTGAADRQEPTGLMTHHRVHDAGCRRFVDRFVAFVRDHPAARWLDASEVFAPPRNGRDRNQPPRL